MTLVSQIITDALRQSNLLPIGVEPTLDQQSEALTYLNRIVKSVFGKEVGEELQSFPVGKDGISRPSGYPWYNTIPDNEWYVSKNLRLLCNLEEAVDLYLHPDPDDGSRFAVVDVAENFATHNVTIKGNGRRVEGSLEVTLNTNGTNEAWFYRGDLGNWVKYTNLAISDTFPFPEEFDDFFITFLAIRLNPAYGRALDEQSKYVFDRSRSQLRARYSQEIQVRSELGLIRMARVDPNRDAYRYDIGTYDPNVAFDKGKLA